MRAALPPAASAPSKDGGATPHFSVKLPALGGTHPITERTGCRSCSGATRRPGNMTLSQRGKIWLAVIVWSVMTWGSLFWVMASLYRGAGQ